MIPPRLTAHQLFAHVALKSVPEPAVRATQDTWFIAWMFGSIVSEKVGEARERTLDHIATLADAAIDHGVEAFFDLTGIEDGFVQSDPEESPRPGLAERLIESSFSVANDVLDIIQAPKRGNRFFSMPPEPGQ